MIRKIELSWATVNTADPAEMAEFRVQQERLANQRAKAAFEHLKSLGIIDEHGNRLAKNFLQICAPGQSAILAANVPPVSCAQE
jgi:hypothetical protein